MTQARAFSDVEGRRVDDSDDCSDGWLLIDSEVESSQVDAFENDSFTGPSLDPQVAGPSLTSYATGIVLTGNQRSANQAVLVGRQDIADQVWAFSFVDLSGRLLREPIRGIVADIRVSAQLINDASSLVSPEPRDTVRHACDGE